MLKTSRDFGLWCLPGRDRDAVSLDTPDTEPLPEKMEGLSTC